MVSKLVENIRPKIVLMNDEIVKINTPGNALFYIVSGTVAVYSNKGKEVIFDQKNHLKIRST